MGIGGISIWQLAIVLAIVLVLFGTKRLRTVGGDLGGAIRGFKDSMNEQDIPSEESQLSNKDSSDITNKGVSNN